MRRKFYSSERTKKAKTTSTSLGCSSKTFRLDLCQRNITKTFPNLNFLTFWGCGFEEISREDLKGLENLEYFNFGNNHLTTLPDELFADMKKLREVFFTRNKLERLTSKLLMPIKSTLEIATFEDNTRISDRFAIKKGVESASTDTNAHVINLQQMGIPTAVNSTKTSRNDLKIFMKTIDEKCWPPVPRSQGDQLVAE